MAKSDHLNRYAEGWTKGDGAIIVSSLDDAYQLDDPNTGMISKQGFADYFAGLTQIVEGIRGKSGEPFMEVSELLTHEEGDLLTAWVWWAIPGTPIQGGGLIKVGEGGVVSERLTYYTKLSEG